MAVKKGVYRWLQIRCWAHGPSFGVFWASPTASFVVSIMAGCFLLLFSLTCSIMMLLRDFLLLSVFNVRCCRSFRLSSFSVGNLLPVVIYYFDFWCRVTVVLVQEAFSLRRVFWYFFSELLYLRRGYLQGTHGAQHFEEDHSQVI